MKRSREGEGEVNLGGLLKKMKISSITAEKETQTDEIYYSAADVECMIRKFQSSQSSAPNDDFGQSHSLSETKTN